MKRALVVLSIALATVVGGCMDGPPLPARVRYNEGVKALAENKLEDAAKAFLDARSEAGYDGALRYRAAFNLGETYARQGEKAAADGAEHDAAAAIEHYRQAAAWFSDALRLQKDDADARANLERVQARILALVDEANKGASGLEKRLDELISGERKLRDLVRGLWQAQDQRGAGADPLADKDAFDATSTQQRTLGAEAGVVADLAGDEITAIGGKAEAQRKDEEKARLVQLQNLDLYVQDARKEMTDARRNLTELKAELAYRRVEGALEALKRAREQLLDPITVLRGVAQDHVELLGHVAAIEQARGELKLGQARPEIPQWMQPVALGGQQLDIRARLEEVKARLAAAKDQEKVKDAIAAALPAIDQASAAMMRATEALRADDVKTAAVAQREALEALARAIEQFLDLRGLIDISLSEQGPVVAALTPPAEGQPPLSPADRARIVGDGAARNRERIARMAAMIAEAAKPPPPPPDAQGAQGAQGAQPGQPPAQPEDAEAAKQREALYGRAEALRAEAQVALDQLVAVAKGGKGPPALESARTAQQKLEEMQQLFFSVIEHLKKLVRDQGETRDKTSDAVVQDDISRRPLLPPITQRQGGHVQAADAIASALAQQADAAAQAEAQGQGQGQGQGQPQGGPGAAAFKEAAGEVRNALTSMQTAIETLTKASDPSATMSFDLSPVTESQQQAIEHLENALRLLQPPQKQDEKQDDQKQDQQKQDQQKQDQQQQQQQQQQQDQSKDDAEKRLQQVREREAQRQRERREQQRSAPDPVDKDW
ncbi:MAG TPA: hypothetical protein VM261_21800 [Kofleriaceae bacterium]|nr:hypothetical protein [Kofleriaceae bacterium]